MASKGTVVIDGRTYEITGLRFYGGELKISAVNCGPVRPCENVAAAVFGEDGIGVCQSWHVTISPAQAAASEGARSSLTVVLPVRIETIKAAAS